MFFPVKISMFQYDLLAKKHFWPVFYARLEYFPILVGMLTLWCHSDVTRIWLVLILVSIERGDPYLYIGSKYKGLDIKYRKTKAPPSTWADVLQKMARADEG